jgi:hypothetical protein
MKLSQLVSVCALNTIAITLLMGLSLSVVPVSAEEDTCYICKIGDGVTVCTEVECGKKAY